MPSDHKDGPNAPLNKRRLWLALIPALTLPLIAAFGYYRWWSGTAMGACSYIGIKLFLILWPIVVVRYFCGLKLGRVFEFRGSGMSLIAGLLTGFGMLGVLAGLFQFNAIADLFSESATNIGQHIKGMSMADHYLMFSLGIAVIHSAVEEFYWRWFVFGQLRNLVPVYAAHLIAAVGFTLHHLVLLDEIVPLWAVVFFGLLIAACGFVWSYIFQKFEGLLGPWISHLLIDLGLVWIGWKALQMV